MTPKRRYGQTMMGPVHNLPDLVIDFAEGQELPAGLGKTEAPVRNLPDLEIDFDDAAHTPMLQLTLALREGENAPAKKLAVDLVRLFAVVNELELSAGGAGLEFDDASCDAVDDDGKIRICLKPADPNGAEERLRVLVDRINQDAALIPASFERCEARIAA